MLLALALLSLQDKVSYQDHVLPIFNNRCNSCHNADKKKGDLDLSTYGTALAGGGSGESAVPGASGDSMLWKVVAHLTDPKMPPKQPKLPDAELAVIKAWIDGGLIENAGGKARAAAKPKFDLALKTPSGKPAGAPAMPEDLPLEPVLRTARAEAVVALAAAPWAPVVAVSGQHQVLLYHPETFDLLGVLPFPERRAHVLRFSRNGQLLLAGGGRGAGLGKVAVWDVRTGDRVIEVGQEFDAVLAADLSADQSKIALGGPGKVVKIFSTRSGGLTHSIKKHTDWVTALEFSPDGVLLASGDRSGGVHIWEAASGNLFYSLNGHKAGVNEVSWRADSNLLATGGEDGQVFLWEMGGGNKVKNWQAHDAVQSVRFSVDGNLVTCGRDRLVRTWDGNGTKTRDLEAFSDMAMRGAFTHDGKRVVAGDWTGEIRVYSAADGKRLGDLSVNPPAIQDRLALAVKQLPEAEAKHAKAVADEAAVAQAAKAAADGLATADKAAAGAAEALKAAETRQAQAGAAADVATKALASADADVKARQADAAAKGALAKQAVDAQAKSAGELANLQGAAAAALKKIQEGVADAAKELDAAQKSTADKTAELLRLAEAALKAKVEAAAAESAMGPPQKAHAEKQAAQKEAAEQLAAAGTALAQAKAQAPLAAQAAEAARKAAAVAAAEQVKAKAAMDGAAAAGQGARFEIAHWTAAQFYLKVDAEKRELAKVQAETDKLMGQAEQTRHAADAAVAAVKAGEKAAADAQAAIKAAQDASALAQAAPEKARAAHEESKKALAAKEILHQEAGALAAKLAGPAAAKAQELVALLQQDVAAGKMAMAAREADVQKAVAAVPVAQEVVVKAQAAAAAAAKKVVDLHEASKMAEEVAAAEKSKTDAFAPTLNAAKAKVEAVRGEYLKLKPKKSA